MTCTNASCCTHGHTNARTAPLRPSCTHTHTCPTTLCPLSPSCTHTHAPQPFVPSLPLAHTHIPHNPLSPITPAQPTRAREMHANLPSRVTQIFLQGKSSFKGWDAHKSSFKGYAAAGVRGGGADLVEEEELGEEGIQGRRCRLHRRCCIAPYRPPGILPPPLRRE
jgi:hypothetical protein